MMDWNEPFPLYDTHTVKTQCILRVLSKFLMIFLCTKSKEFLMKSGAYLNTNYIASKCTFSLMTSINFRKQLSFLFFFTTLLPPE